MLPENILTICRAIQQSRGRALLVGGFVRDYLMGQTSKDFDIEVFGLPLETLHQVLSTFGEVITVGKSFGVLRLKHIDVDFSLPRLDNKIGVGHKGFNIVVDETLDFATAAKRRDLTINSIGLDPLTHELLDPHNGASDLKNRILRATDPVHFSEDPLRALRVMQFIARLEMQPNADLIALCATLDLSELSKERIFSEFKKLVLKGKKPSLGLQFLRQTNLLRFFKAIEALIDTPQEPKYHPEGDVFTHTLMVLDEAALLREDGIDNLALMFGALCHDFGKPSTTTFDGTRIRSLKHDVAGIAIAEQFLHNLMAPHELITKVKCLVHYHLAPAQFVQNAAKPKAYRRLARELQNAGLSMQDLARVAKADHLGRTVEEALQRKTTATDAFLANAQSLEILTSGPEDVVLGRHLLARGLKPGPEFSVLLNRCRELQDELGLTNAEEILDQILKDQPPV